MQIRHFLKMKSGKYWPGITTELLFTVLSKHYIEHKIIHKIVVDNQLVKYAIDNAMSHKDEHAHFYCNVCNALQCMDNVPVEKYALPDGYSDVETEVLIKGTCANCKKQESN